MDIDKMQREHVGIMQRLAQLEGARGIGSPAGRPPSEIIDTIARQEAGELRAVIESLVQRSNNFEERLAELAGQLGELSALIAGLRQSLADATKPAEAPNPASAPAGAAVGPDSTAAGTSGG